jgi:hypothetical protein
MSIFNNIVRKEISAGVLLLGIFVSFSLWFVAYKETIAETFNYHTIIEMEYKPDVK